MNGVFREPPQAENQREVVAELLRLRRIEGLDCIEAIQRNVLRLPNRISELRKLKWIIRQVRERNGVVRYFLVGEPSGNSELDPSGPASSPRIDEASELSAFPSVESPDSYSVESERLRTQVAPLFASTGDQERGE